MTSSWRHSDPSRDGQRWLKRAPIVARAQESLSIHSNVSDVRPVLVRSIASCMTWLTLLIALAVPATAITVILLVMSFAAFGLIATLGSSNSARVVIRIVQQYAAATVFRLASTLLRIIPRRWIRTSSAGETPEQIEAELLLQSVALSPMVRFSCWLVSAGYSPESAARCIARLLGIPIIPISMEIRHAYLLNCSGERIICVSDRLDQLACGTAILHELVHHLLGHEMEDPLILAQRSRNHCDARILAREREADTASEHITSAITRVARRSSGLALDEHSPQRVAME